MPGRCPWASFRPKICQKEEQHTNTDDSQVVDVEAAQRRPPKKAIPTIPSINNPISPKWDDRDKQGSEVVGGQVGLGYWVLVGPPIGAKAEPVHSSQARRALNGLQVLPDTFLLKSLRDG